MSPPRSHQSANFSAQSVIVTWRKSGEAAATAPASWHGCCESQYAAPTVGSFQLKENPMSRDYSQRYRDGLRFGDQDRYGTGQSSRYGNASPYEDPATHWNDEQTARWLSHYGSASRRGERDDDPEGWRDYERPEYMQGYGSRHGYENPRYAQRMEESWRGYWPNDPWRQRGAERIGPAMHGRYGRRSEDAEQGSLNFQPGDQDYAGTYGPTFGSTYRRAGQAYEPDYGRAGSRNWREENWYHANELGGAASYHGRGPAGYVRSDERIREDVCDRLTDHPHVDASAIDVSVQNGVVTLQGQVPERQMKHRAEDCVEHISGVKDVENRLRVGREGWNREEEGEQRSGSGVSASSRNH
jgi:osmotically-inducible protein OsmY